MAIFVSYSDESGAKDPGRTFLIGGYVASEEDWPYFSRAWQERVLDRRPAIPYLHMREVRRPEWRRKYGISRFEIEERIDEAVSVVSSSGFLSLIVATIERADLEEILHKQAKAKHVASAVSLKAPDYFCFLLFGSTALEQVHALYSEITALHFAVDTKSEITDHIRAFHKELKLATKPPLNGLIGELLPLQSQSIPALQAADLLCWHFQRYYSAGADGSKMDSADC